MASRIDGDVIIGGSLTVGGTNIPSAGSVGDSKMDAGSPSTVEKLEHLYKPGTNFDLPIATTPPVAREEIVHVVSTVGVLRGFHALLDEDGTTTDIDFDLKINGVTALTAVVNIVDTTGDRVVVDGTLTTTVLAVDDVISISMAVTSGTAAAGPYAWCEIDETAATS